MTQKVKKLNDAAIPRLTEIADDALVTVVDKTTGAVSNIEYGKLKSQLAQSFFAGGRNLLSTTFASFSTAFTKDGDRCITLVENRDAYFSVKVACQSSELEYGKEYTVSFRAEGLGDGDKWVFTSRNGQGFSIQVKNGLNYGSFIMNESFVQNNCLLFDDATRLFPNGLHNVKLSQFKLERGSIATAWSLAPEDILEKIGGGVKLLFTTLCVAPSIYRKGGQRHEQDEKGDGGNACRPSAPCNGLQRNLSESRYGDSARSIHHVDRHGLRKSSDKHGHILEICHSGGVFPEQCHIRTDYGAKRNGLQIYTQWRGEVLGCDSLAERKEVVAA